jgi:type II secretory pathway component GspD/PulD (secretin)
MGGTGMMPGAMGLNQMGVMGQPGMLGQTGLLGQTAQSDRDTEDLMQEMGFEYNQFGNLNALIVRYTDPSALAKLKQFIVELDKPTPQVSLQTKFVTVNQEKAKEFSMNWNLTDHNSPTVLSPTTDEDGNVVTTAAGLATDYLDIISNDYTVSPEVRPSLSWEKRLNGTCAFWKWKGS